LKMIYDVIIVGGGPSGSFLGSLLAKSGFNIAILEKARFPRDKPCGGGISPKAIDILGIDLSPIVEQNISRGILSYNNEQVIIRDKYPYLGITVDRLKFDSLLMDNAISSGVRFYDNHEVIGFNQANGIIRIETRKNSFSSKYLIGADGVNSRIRNLLFDNEIVYSVPAVTSIITADSSAIQNFNNSILFDFGIIENGYAWIFPLKTRINIGIYSPFPKKNLKSNLLKLANVYPGAKIDTSKIKVKAARIPLVNLAGKYQKGNVWLIGDAGGLCESFFGEGVFYALKSSKIAFEVLRDDFSFSNSKDNYTKRVSKEIVCESGYSRLLAKIFYYNTKLSYRLVVRNDYLSGLFANTLAGTISYRSLFYKALFSAPYWLISKRTPLNPRIQ